MDRRQVLKLGAALTALPLAGCGASPPPPPAPTATPGDKTAAVNPSPAKPAEPPPPQTTASAPDASGAEPPPAPAKEEAPKTDFTRVVGRLGKNHGHVIAVPFEDVLAGAEKTYDCSSSGGHDHKVTLTADDMKSLLAGKVVRTKSTVGLTHAHRFVARCAPPVDPPEWVSVVKFSPSGQDEHEIIVTAADMAAKADKTYDIQGLAGHSHALSLTAADFEKLQKRAPVTLQCSREPNDAHRHTCTIEYKPKSNA